MDPHPLHLRLLIHSASHRLSLHSPLAARRRPVRQKVVCAKRASSSGKIGGRRADHCAPKPPELDLCAFSCQQSDGSSISSAAESLGGTPHILLPVPPIQPGDNRGRGRLKKEKKRKTGEGEREKENRKKLQGRWGDSHTIMSFIHNRRLSQIFYVQINVFSFFSF